MAKNKTAETTSSVTDFLNTVADETKRADAFRLIDILQTQTGFEPKLWGSSIVGFGSYHYKYASGHQGDAPIAGFSPRKDAIVLYLMQAPEERENMLQQLGKHKAGKGCIYVKKLADIQEPVLRQMIDNSVKYVKKLYPR